MEETVGSSSRRNTRSSLEIFRSYKGNLKMLRFVLAVALLAVGAQSVIVDKNCTGADGKWTDRALGCDNKVSDAVCDSFAGSQTALAVGTDTERAVNCFQMNSVDSEEKKQAMIKICPSTCGYCCLTDEYKCANKDFPGVTCSTITQAQCKDRTWREIIASDCPNVCGFCLEGGCVDAAIECANDKSICRNVDMQAFTQANCKKTCGYCTSSTSSLWGSTTMGGCIDTNRNCASWRTNGFCSNNFYTDAVKRQNCARTCSLC